MSSFADFSIAKVQHWIANNPQVSTPSPEMVVNVNPQDPQHRQDRLVSVGSSHGRISRIDMPNDKCLSIEYRRRYGDESPNQDKQPYNSLILGGFPAEWDQEEILKKVKAEFRHLSFDVEFENQTRHMYIFFKNPGQAWSVRKFMLDHLKKPDVFGPMITVDPYFESMENNENARPTSVNSTVPSPPTNREARDGPQRQGQNHVQAEEVEILVPPPPPPTIPKARGFDTGPTPVIPLAVYQNQPPPHITHPPQSLTIIQKKSFPMPHAIPVMNVQSMPTLDLNKAMEQARHLTQAQKSAKNWATVTPPVQSSTVQAQVEDMDTTAQNSAWEQAEWGNWNQSQPTMGSLGGTPKKREPLLKTPMSIQSSAPVENPNQRKTNAVRPNAYHRLDQDSSLQPTHNPFAKAAAQEPTRATRRVFNDSGSAMDTDERQNLVSPDIPISTDHQDEFVRHAQRQMEATSRQPHHIEQAEIRRERDIRVNRKMVGRLRDESPPRYQDEYIRSKRGRSMGAELRTRDRESLSTRRRGSNSPQSRPSSRYYDEERRGRREYERETDRYRHERSSRYDRRSPEDRYRSKSSHHKNDDYYRGSRSRRSSPDDKWDTRRRRSSPSDDEWDRLRGFATKNRDIRESRENYEEQPNRSLINLQQKLRPIIKEHRVQDPASSSDNVVMRFDLCKRPFNAAVDNAKILSQQGLGGLATAQPTAKAAAPKQNALGMLYPATGDHNWTQDDSFLNRTLYIGNLPVDATEEAIREFLRGYDVTSVVIKKRECVPFPTAFAFVKFKTLVQAKDARVRMHSKTFCEIPKHNVYCGYAKIYPTSRLWIGELPDWYTRQELETLFKTWGAVEILEYVQGMGFAFVRYAKKESAIFACRDLKNQKIGDEFINIDFASDDEIYPDLIVPNRKRPSVDRNVFEPRQKRSYSPLPANDNVPSSSSSGADVYFQPIVQPVTPVQQNNGHGHQILPISPPDLNNYEMPQVIDTVEKLASEVEVMWTGNVTFKKRNFAFNFYRVAGSEELAIDLKRLNSIVIDNKMSEEISFTHKLDDPSRFTILVGVASQPITHIVAYMRNHNVMPISILEESMLHFLQPVPAQPQNNPQNGVLTAALVEQFCPSVKELIKDPNSVVLAVLRKVVP